MRRFLLALSLLAAACGSAPSHPTDASGRSGPLVPAEPITEASLTAWVGKSFPDGVKRGVITLDYGSAGTAQTVIDELAIMGITTITQLAAITPSDFATKGVAAIQNSRSPTDTIAGLMRDLMIIHDAKTYFEKAWKQSWSASGPDDFPAPAAYGVDFAVFEQAGVFGSSYEEEGGGE